MLLPVQVAMDLRAQDLLDDELPRPQRSMCVVCGLQMSERCTSDTRSVQVAKGSEMHGHDPVLKDLNI